MNERKRRDENSSYLSIDQFYKRERNMMKKKEDKSRETYRKNTYKFCALVIWQHTNRI